MLTPPEVELPARPIVNYHEFTYQAGSWNRPPPRVVARVDGPGVTLAPLGIIANSLSYAPKSVTRFCNGRGIAEQWIKEGKYAPHWTRPSCHQFVANQVRLALFVLAYNLCNFVHRLALPQVIMHWSLTSLQTRLLKTGGRLVQHARRLVFQIV